MEKKRYICPEIMIVKTVTTATLMAGSTVGVSGQAYNSETNGPIRSREGSFWDDEE